MSKEKNKIIFFFFWLDCVFSYMDVERIMTRIYSPPLLELSPRGEGIRDEKCVDAFIIAI